MNAHTTARVILALLIVLLFTGCMPYDGIRFLTITDPTTRAGYLIGNGLFWLGIFIALGLFFGRIFSKK